MTQLRQRSVNEIALARAIEPASLVTWPAREILPFSGWLLRFTDGLGHRPNSVATQDFDGADDDAAIDVVERAYRARDLRPMFQITPAAKPVDLARKLEARGYVAVTPSMVCVADVETVRSKCEPTGGGEVQTGANAGFDGLVISGSHTPEDGRERLDVLARLGVPRLRVTILVQGVAVACGMGAATDGRVGINLMRTHADFRRRGHARQVLGAIADWAAAQGASKLFLSVEQANAPAHALYEGAGFARAYSYRYYRKG